MTENKQRDNNKIKAGRRGPVQPGLEALHKIKQTALTRADLAEMLHQATGLPKSASAVLVVQIIERIATAIANGENVKISGFGSFNIRHKASRIGRNPKTGVGATISERNVVTFRPSETLRDRVNSANRHSKNRTHARKR